MGGDAVMDAESLFLAKKYVDNAAYELALTYDNSNISTGYAIDYTTGDVISYSAACAKDIDCSKFSLISILGRTNAGLVFYDNAGNRIKPSGSSNYSTASNNGDFIVPVGAIRCSIGMNTVDISTISIIFSKGLYQTVGTNKGSTMSQNAIAYAIQDVSTSYTYPNGSLITNYAVDYNTGGIVAATGGASAQYAYCKGFTKLIINNRSNAGLVFYDAAGAKIKPVGRNDYTTIANNGTFSIPANAVACSIGLLSGNISNVSIVFTKLAQNIGTDITASMSQKAISDNFNAVHNKNLYHFSGTINGDVTATGWTQASDGITQDTEGISTPFKLNKYYAISNKKVIYDFVPGLSAKVAFFTIPNSAEWMVAGSMVDIDFSAGRLNIHAKYDYNTPSTIPSVLQYKAFTVPSNHSTTTYRLEWQRIDKGMIVTLYSLTDYSVIVTDQILFTSEVDTPAWGFMHDYFACAVLTGTVKLKSLDVMAPNAENTFLYIVGDSITDGTPLLQYKGYAFLLKSILPNTVVSGRSGGNIDGVAPRIASECAILKPKYVMVLIGTNGGNTAEKLASLVSAIKALNAIPIICCVPCTTTSNQSTVNSLILALGEKTVRMDIATASSYNISNVGDSAIFYDSLHPNADGYVRMLTRIKIDLPELFN